MIEITELIDAGVEVVEVFAAAQEVVEVIDTTQDVVEISGPQGPTGPQGPAGDVVVYVADAALGGHRVVRITGTGVDYADCTAPAHVGLVAGITTGAVAQGASAAVANREVVAEPSWAWTAGEPVMLGSNGVLTQTPPANAVFAQVIGVALSATSLFVNVQPPITLGD